MKKINHKFLLPNRIIIIKIQGINKKYYEKNKS